MRKLMAIVALLCGAASAEAATAPPGHFFGPYNFCFGASDRITFEDRGLFVRVRVANKSARLPYKLGKQGYVLQSGEKMHLQQVHVSFNDTYLFPIVFRDHVFWPCPAQN